MKYLVTGGAGFIGSNLCRKLLEAGHSVICLDDFSTGREKNILGLKNNSSFTFVRHDITKSFFTSCISAANCSHFSLLFGMVTGFRWYQRVFSAII